MYVAVSNEPSVGVAGTVGPFGISVVDFIHWYFNELVFTPTLSVTVTVVLCDFAHVVFPFGLKVTVDCILSNW